MIQKSCLFACILGLSVTLSAADGPASDGGSSPNTTTTTTSAPAPANPEIDALKKVLIEQQKQIDELRQQVKSDKSNAESKPAAAAAQPAPAAATEQPAPAPATLHPSSGEVASTTPIVPPSPVPAPAPIVPPTNSSNTSSNAAPSSDPVPQNIAEDATAPLHLKIGDAYITPVGFMDATLVSRSTNAGTGIGTNFGSIPYGNTQAGALTETRMSLQNSRIGARFDAIYRGASIMGYWESDFLGQLGNPPNGGLAVTSNPYVLRLRLYWADIRKNKFEFLAGQTWSLMTPNRYGLSPLPGDIFYSQNMDVNYQNGLVWGRIPEFRFVYHPSNTVAFGVALSNSEQYVGGANGGSVIVAPTALAGLLGTEVNNGTTQITAPQVFPDVIAKLAFDPSRRFHIEVAGVEIAQKIANPNTTPAYQTFSKVGGGGSINLNWAFVPNVRLIGNNYWSDGGGRYIFGSAPDFIIRADGSLSLVHSAATLWGLEATLGNTVLYTYYGGVYIGQNLTLDTNGKPVGYGPLSSDGQNRTIQEATIGTNTTIWKDSKWGAFNLITQLSYVQRNPWLAAIGAPSNANMWEGFVDFRYTLPGAPPVLKP